MKNGDEGGTNWLCVRHGGWLMKGAKVVLKVERGKGGKVEGEDEAKAEAKEEVKAKAEA